MIFRRRRPIVIVVIAAFTFALVSLLHYGVPNWHRHIPSFGLGAIGAVSTWNNVPIHFPVRNLRTLPSSQPKQLPRVQFEFPAETKEEQEVRLGRRMAVRNAFARCYNSYHDHAWMKDELTPLSGDFQNTFGGWAATLVDSLDTLAIMGFKDELQTAIQAAAKIDFTTSSNDVINVFETNIRYLGGFLAAYDLTGDEIMLGKAIEVGEMLLLAFDTPNHMPVSRWHWEIAKTGTPQQAPESMVVAELGSFTLEFARLSQVTGDMRWYDAVARITDLFDKQAKKTKLPGLWPVGVNPNTQDLYSESSFSLGAMADSLYEYFPKVYALLGGNEPVYRKLYENAMAQSIEHLFFRPMTPENLDILVSGKADVYTKNEPATETEIQHLGCFTGGMLALGGKLFSKADHVTIGQKLTDGCIWAYNSSVNGVMPELAHLAACTSTTDCIWNETAWHEVVKSRNFISSDKDVSQFVKEKSMPPGFVGMNDRRYLLRPEAIESVFILYRITGDRRFQDQAWQMFTSIQKLTETQYANAAVHDVTRPLDSIKLEDSMESFWLGETLKYFYLIFSNPDLISLDEYVFNTEAHPFLRPG